MAIEPWTAEAAALRREYERDRERFLRRGFRFAYWRHGGERGPDWVSDLVEIIATGDGVVAVWTKARPSPADFTVTDVEKRQGSPPVRMVLLVLDCVLGDALFERVIPAERLTQYRGTINETLTFEMPPVRLEKTLYRAEALPETERLRGALATITRWLTEEGRLLPP